MRWGDGRRGTAAAAAATGGRVHSAQVPGSRRPRRRAHQAIRVPEEHRRRLDGDQTGRQRAAAQDQIRRAVRTVDRRPAAATAATFGLHQRTRSAQRAAEEDAGLGADHERRRRTNGG